MSLAKSNPTSTPVVIPIGDVSSIPRLPKTLRDLAPAEASDYEEEMRIWWRKIIDTINSVAQKG